MHRVEPSKARKRLNNTLEGRHNAKKGDARAAASKHARRSNNHNPKENQGPPGVSLAVCVSSAVLTHGPASQHIDHAVQRLRRLLINLLRQEQAGVNSALSVGGAANDVVLELKRDTAVW